VDREPVVIVIIVFTRYEAGFRIESEAEPLNTGARGGRKAASVGASSAGELRCRLCKKTRGPSLFLALFLLLLLSLLLLFVFLFVLLAALVSHGSPFRPRLCCRAASTNQCERELPSALSLIAQDTRLVVSQSRRWTRHPRHEHLLLRLRRTSAGCSFPYS